jgi:hypothetical protein
MFKAGSQPGHPAPYTYGDGYPGAELSFRGVGII